MSAGSAVESMRPVHAPRLYRFCWIGKRGPVLKYFTNIQAFSGYIAEVRRICGAEAVDFRTPVLAIGVLP